MTRQLTFSVVADGGTDRILVPIIQWAIHRLDPEVEILEPLFSKRSGSVREFLCDYDPGVMLVFVHRDAENRTLEERLGEFEFTDRLKIVPVIPVRMSEAWLLFDGTAIAQAAGRPGYPVSTPRLSEIERMSDPKKHLDELLLLAAGSPSGRRGRVFRRSIIERRVNVAGYIADYSPLENQMAFRCFQDHLERNYPYGPVS